MTALAIARSSLVTSLTRYGRSWGLWLLLLVAPIGARFWVPREDGSAIVIAIGSKLPVMTAGVIGLCLGIVVSTLLLPIGWAYLRANTNRRQPWQIEEVTAGSRVAIALGRFGADVTMFFALLAALNAAGLFLAWLILPAGGVRPLELTLALWAIAAPALMGLAALRILADALPPTRGALGDVLFFVLWITSLGAPIAEADRPHDFAAAMSDFPGFVRPLMVGAGSEHTDFQIGVSEVSKGRVPVDAIKGLTSPYYLEARVAWAGIAIVAAAFAGFVYRPHKPRRRRLLSARLAKLLSPGAPPAANAAAPPAGFARSPALNLVLAEARLILPGRAFLMLAAAVAALGLFADFRAVNVAALLLLVFGLTAQAGRAEARKFQALSITTAFGPWPRRFAFVAAGTGWSVLLALPAILRTLDPVALGTAAASGAAFAAGAALLAALSGSAFAPRLILLVLWYGWSSS